MAIHSAINYFIGYSAFQVHYKGLSTPTFNFKKSNTFNKIIIQTIRSSSTIQNNINRLSDGIHLMSGLVSLAPRWKYTAQICPVGLTAQVYV